MVFPTSRAEAVSKSAIHIRALRALSSYGPRAVLLTVVPIANFASITIAGRYLPVSEFGLLSLVLALNGGMNAVLTQPLAEAVARFHNDAVKSHQHDHLLRTATLFTFGLTLLISLLFLLGLIMQGSLAPAGGIVAPLLLWATLPYFLAYMTLSLTSTYLNIKQAYGHYFLTAAGPPILSTMMIAATGIFHRANAGLAIALQALAICLFLAPYFLARISKLMAVVRSILRRPLESEKDFMAAFGRYAAPQMFVAIATYIFMFGDRFVIAHFFELADVGRYSYIYVLTMGISVAFANAYAGATYYHTLEVYSHSQTAAQRQRLLRRFVWISAATPFYFIPLIAIYALEGDRIVALVFGAHATVPVGCLPLMATSAALFSGAQQLGLVANILKRQQVLVLPRWGSAFLFITLIAAYHPSLFAICIVAVLVNAMNICIILATVLGLARRANAHMLDTMA